MGPPGDSNPPTTSAAVIKVPQTMDHRKRHSVVSMISLDRSPKPQYGSILSEELIKLFKVPTSVLRNVSQKENKEE